MLLNEHYWFFKKALSNEVCNKIIETGLQHPMKKGLVGNSKGIDVVQKKTRQSTITWLNDTWVYNIIHPYVETANRNAGWNFQWDFSETMQFTIYKKNQFYTWHTDQRSKPYPSDHTNVNYRNKIRKLSVTVQLNNGKDYSGGELEFDLKNKKTGNTKQICKAGKEKGTIVVFPSFIWHRVRPVTKGKRISLVMWNIGAPFI